MSPDDGFILVEDGVRLFFRKVGAGPKVILIPNGMYLFDDFIQFAESRTLIFYDVRNRGFSDPVTDSSKLAHGILQDVEDLDAVRSHFGINQVDLIGHSYIGLIAGLYTLKHPSCVNRVVQIGPVQPDAGKQYPAHLMNTDVIGARVFSALAQLQREKRPEDDPVETCTKFWSVLREIYVANPADAEKINWGRCDLPNERNFMKYLTAYILPSIQKVHLTAQDLANVKTPVLIIHGRSDRSAPYGGARDWALMWPNARLLTVQNSAHAPWIESPEIVFNALHDFLDGKWPQSAETVSALEP